MLTKPILKAGQGLLLCLLLVACGDSAVTPVPAASPPTSTSSPTTAPGTTIALASLSPLATFTPAPLATTPNLAAPPEQASSGPGGSSYSYGSVIRREGGEGGQKYFVFEPASPAPKSAPVIVLLHGYTDIAPLRYIPWINHLVRRGNIIIFPVYQETALETNGSTFTPNAIAAVKNALESQQNGTGVKPELDKFSVVGYSAGGIIAANLVASAAKNGLPVPKALFAVTPGGCINCSNFGLTDFKLDTEGLKTLPASLKLLVLVGDRDVVVGIGAAKFMWDNIGGVPATNRDFIMVNSDTHGSPKLLADHGMGNRNPPDALNYFGIWKLTDALESCALSGKDCETAFGNTPAQRYMGKWSDGVPVAELTVTKKP